MLQRPPIKNTITSLHSNGTLQKFSDPPPRNPKTYTSPNSHSCQPDTTDIRAHPTLPTLGRGEYWLSQHLQDTTHRFDYTHTHIHTCTHTWNVWRSRLSNGECDSRKFANKTGGCRNDWRRAMFCFALVFSARRNFQRVSSENVRFVWI